MNFREAVIAKSLEKRKELIETQLYGTNWVDLMDKIVSNVGWYDEIVVHQITIDESDSEWITVNVLLLFTEAIPTSCPEITIPDRGRAECEIVILRDGGDHFFNETSDDSENYYSPADYN
jgi:hypothetical protein